MWLIIRKELFEHILTFRFIVGFIACNLLFGVITYVLAQDFLLRQERIEAAKVQENETRAGWQTWSYVRPTVFKESSPLSVFATAGGRQYGSRVWISHSRVPVFTEDEATGGTDSDFLGFFFTFDFVTIAGLFISLMALLFSFDLVSGEKERATLRLLLSYSVQRSILFISKFLGSLLALAVVVASATILSIIVLTLVVGTPMSPEDWLSLAMMFLAGLLYGAVFVALGLLISTRLHTTASSLIVCMMAWVGLVLLLPSAIAFFTSEFGLSRDARDFDRNMSALLEEYSPQMFLFGYDPRDYEFLANVHGGRDGQIVYRMVGDNARKRLRPLLPQALAAQNAYAEKRFGLEEAYRARRQEKTALSVNLLRISPVSSYANLLNAIARADMASHEDFMAQARRHREEVIAYIRGKGGYESDRWFTNDVPNALHRDFVNLAETMTLQEMGAFFTGEQAQEFHLKFKGFMDAMDRDPARRLNLSDLPAFEWKRPDLFSALTHAATDLILLIAVAAVFITLSAISFNRYDPR
jgi:ABC-type transport system involved in multi-copper enzyme maturation permease subunit